MFLRRHVRVVVSPTAHAGSRAEFVCAARNSDRVGFLPGDFDLYPKPSGAAVLDYLGELRGGVDRRVRDQLAERFDAQLDRPIRELSTGNRQKLGLIQAFMHQPERLILAPGCRVRGLGRPADQGPRHHEVRSIRSHDDDLEEIFLRYHRGREGD